MLYTVAFAWYVRLIPVLLGREGRAFGGWD